MVDKVQKLWYRLSVWVVSTCAVYSYIYWGPALPQMATAQTIAYAALQNQLDRRN